MKASEFTLKQDNNAKAKAWIEKVYKQFPQTWQNNHVMPMGGQGDDQQFAMFELTPSMSKKDAVEVKWFQAYPLRQGVGSRAMKKLQALAHEDDISLTLYPWDKGQVSQAKLMKFYRAQGFQPTVKGAKNMMWSPEGVAEGKINPAGLNHTQQIGDYVYRAKALTGSDEGEIEMTAYDGKKSIADTVFMPYGSGGRMISGQTYVHPAYRGKGVAAGMYAYLRMLGFKIEPSAIRTGAGKAMWDKWEKAGDAKHLSKGVAEAFDQPYKGKWEKSDYGDVDMLAKLPDGTNLSIMFNQEYGDEGEEVVQVEFYRNNSQDVTGEGDAQRIFATVLDAIQKYIKKYKPQRLSFSASKAVDMDADDNSAQFNPESRAKLYDRLVQRYSKALGYRAFRADNGDIVIYELSRIKQGVAEGLDNNGVSFKVQKGKNKFATTMTVNNEQVGVYQYDANTGRSVAEIYPKFKGKGLGKLLVLHAIYTAANLGLDFQEDESRTSEYDNVLDSLSSNGYIVDDDGYWYVTGEGEQYLKQALKQDVAEGKQPGKPVVDVILKVMPVAQEIWFHGSRATGQHRKNSDTDILVVIPDDLVGDQYLSVVRILQKLSSHFDNYDIQPTKAGTNIHRIAQEEGRLLWSSKQGVAEATGDKPFDTMMKTIKKGTGKQATADRKEQKQRNQEQTRQAIDNMFGGGNPADKLSIRKKGVAENFADGKHPGRKGLAKRSGVNTKASVSSLRKTAKHSTGEKARMAHWLANMKSGHKKLKEDVQDSKELDEILVRLCELIIQGKKTDSEEYGWVAACVVDPNGGYAVGINEARDHGLRAHAERVAIENYKDRYGDIPRGSVIVTTLSPCNETDDATAQGRLGDSCTDLINKSGITEVYCGYCDHSQKNEHNRYSEIFTGNPQIRELCKKFASTFLPPEQLDELSFLGSPCTKDCSGHRAGYNWSKQRGNAESNSWSQSFNNGAALARAGK